MSVRKCAYLLALSWCAASILISAGIVSSNMFTTFLALSTTMRSGMRFVTCRGVVTDCRPTAPPDRELSSDWQRPRSRHNQASNPLPTQTWCTPTLSPPPPASSPRLRSTYYGSSTVKPKGETFQESISFCLILCKKDTEL